MLASSVVDRGFEDGSGQTKIYKIGICRHDIAEKYCIGAKQQSLTHIMLVLHMNFKLKILYIKFKLDYWCVLLRVLIQSGSGPRMGPKHCTSTQCIKYGTNNNR
jgi:hypothetical protein